MSRKGPRSVLNFYCFGCEYLTTETINAFAYQACKHPDLVLRGHPVTIPFAAVHQNCPLMPERKVIGKCCDCNIADGCTLNTHGERFGCWFWEEKS